VDKPAQRFPPKLSFNIRPAEVLAPGYLVPGDTGDASTDYAPELSELEARLQSGDSLTAQHNAGVVLWRIQHPTCFDVLCSLKNAGKLSFYFTTTLPK